ncbi:MAG: hypothetical protein P8Q86_06370 [Polaribacter sp.]|nr:hypothetical protein [Polaribacter sp.]MDG2074338.1 hypothetical protein [Polaribacter sp.]
MNKKLTPYIYILFFGLFSSCIYGQKNNVFNLKIKSNDSLENKTIKSINYKRAFNNFKNLKETKDSVLSVLNEQGFYTLLLEKLTQQENNYTYSLKLGVKLKETRIKINSKNKATLKSLNLNINNGYLITKNQKLKPLLNLISNYLIENGQFFSKVTLINSEVKNQTLFTELQIQNSKKRTINRTIIKGYSDFPSPFVYHYLNLNKKQILNESNIEEISKKINRLNFTKEIKKPEILFSKDSTLLYIYLKKQPSSNFDGLINFSKENSKLNFRGYLDLNLVNIFNKGEEVKINWRNNSNNKQDFTLKTKIPYLFNSKISTEASFNLYRSDSTFTNTNSKITLSYPLSNNTDFSILYSSENSTNNIVSNNISSFAKKMIGVGLNYNSQKENQFNIGFHVSFGTRESNVKTKQHLVNFSTSGLIKVSEKIHFLIRNKSSFLSSDSYLENELFREGGNNSIRGFKEQTILTSKFSFINSELRLLSINNSYIYSIHDAGVFYINSKNSILYSVGVGYNYVKNNNSIDISYALGASTEAISTINSSILSIKVLTNF